MKMITRIQICFQFPPPSLLQHISTSYLHSVLYLSASLHARQIPKSPASQPIVKLVYNCIYTVHFISANCTQCTELQSNAMAIKGHCSALKMHYSPLKTLCTALNQKVLKCIELYQKAAKCTLLHYVALH